MSLSQEELRLARIIDDENPLESELEAAHARNDILMGLLNKAWASLTEVYSTTHHVDSEAQAEALRKAHATIQEIESHG